MNPLSSLGSRSTPSRLRRAGFVAGVLALFGAAGPYACAQHGNSNGGGGGPGPGAGGGTIYHRHVGRKQIHTVDSDGANATALGFGTDGPPSTVTHNGYRWFIDLRAVYDSSGVPETYPNGNARVEVFAFRDDYAYDTSTQTWSGGRLQLTFDATLQPLDSTYGLAWIPGDAGISFKARRWSGTQIVAGGLYVLPLLNDTGGNLVGSAAAPTAPAIPFALDAQQLPGFHSYCWNPTGDHVAFAASNALWVTDLLGSPPAMIYGGGAIMPQWSPDGSKIAFTNGNFGIATIKPDGSRYKEIVRRTSQYVWAGPYWSPWGNDIVFYGSRSGVLNGQDLFCCTASGGSLTNLTNTSSIGEMPLGWR